ncbi:pesticin C-terminus-like muramidase, partial [Rodentibacter pneumotropicus]|uniref:pesticin C-terminus-like muramidase n=2 Tax=Rodentibacter pneumotropicus TaxID=758 RepID=UPI00192DF5EF
IQARSESNGKPIDTVNKSCPEECKVTEIIIFKTSKGNYIISKELWDFILNIEKYVATPYVPSNGIDGKSGVTLGYGYDLGQQTKKQCMMNYLNFIHLSN